MTRARRRRNLVLAAATALASVGSTAMTMPRKGRRRPDSPVDLPVTKTLTGSRAAIPRGREIDEGLDLRIQKLEESFRDLRACVAKHCDQLRKRRLERDNS